MASTVRAELDKAAPVNAAELQRLAKLGSALAAGQRSELLTVTSHIASLALPARALLDVYIVAATAGTGQATILTKGGTPTSSGDCAIDEDGNVLFLAADAVTSAEITYIPIENDLITETISVTTGGLGTFNNSKSCAQLVSATLNSPAATPGAKGIVARGTASPGAGTCAVQDDGTTVQFVAGEAGSACTADVVYHAFPGVGTGAQDSLGDRLEASFTP